MSEKTETLNGVIRALSCLSHQDAQYLRNSVYDIEFEQNTLQKELENAVVLLRGILGYLPSCTLADNTHAFLEHIKEVLDK